MDVGEPLTEPPLVDVDDVLPDDAALPFTEDAAEYLYLTVEPAADGAEDSDRRFDVTEVEADADPERLDTEEEAVTPTPAPATGRARDLAEPPVEAVLCSFL